MNPAPKSGPSTLDIPTSPVAATAGPSHKAPRSVPHIGPSTHHTQIKPTSPVAATAGLSQGAPKSVPHIRPSTDPTPTMPTSPVAATAGSSSWKRPSTEPVPLFSLPTLKRARVQRHPPSNKDSCSCLHTPPLLNLGSPHLEEVIRRCCTGETVHKPSPSKTSTNYVLPEGSKTTHKTLWQLWKEEQQDHLYPQLCQAHQHHLPHLHHSQDQQAQNQNWLSNLDHHYTPNLHREHWKLNSVYSMLQSVDQNYQGMLESINLLRHLTRYSYTHLQHYPLQLHFHPHHPSFTTTPSMSPPAQPRPSSSSSLPTELVTSPATSRTQASHTQTSHTQTSHTQNSHATHQPPQNQPHTPL
ncbi:hypothetical protein EMCRGX_G017101 [Ephydatia muelleri]